MLAAVPAPVHIENKKRIEHQMRSCWEVFFSNTKTRTLAKYLGVLPFHVPYHQSSVLRKENDTKRPSHIWQKPMSTRIFRFQYIRIHRIINKYTWGMDGTGIIHITHSHQPTNERWRYRCERDKWRTAWKKRKREGERLTEWWMREYTWLRSWHHFHVRICNGFASLITVFAYKCEFS